MAAGRPSAVSASGKDGPARLFELGLAAGRPWQPEELAAMWAYHLEAPTQFELGGLGREGAERWFERVKTAGGASASLGDVLRHPAPSLELLEMTKAFAKACLRGADPPLPGGVAGMLYLLAIAVALTRLNRRITALSDLELENAFAWGLAQSWVDAKTRSTLVEARRVLVESR